MVFVQVDNMHQFIYVQWCEAQIRSTVCAHGSPLITFSTVGRFWITHLESKGSHAWILYRSSGKYSCCVICIYACRIVDVGLPRIQNLHCNLCRREMRQGFDSSGHSDKHTTRGRHKSRDESDGQRSHGRRDGHHSEQSHRTKHRSRSKDRERSNRNRSERRR